MLAKISHRSAQQLHCNPDSGFSVSQLRNRGSEGICRDDTDDCLSSVSSVLDIAAEARSVRVYDLR